MDNLLTLSNPVFSSFVFYATVLTLKLILMSPCISYLRLSRKIFENPEDTKAFGKGRRQDETVERLKRLHLNDMENIIPFLIVGPFYVMTSPSLQTALWHFRVFVGARFFHTIAYGLPLPQPSRGTAMYVAWTALLSMVVQIIMTTM